jgi:hypothetical protein
MATPAQQPQLGSEQPTTTNLLERQSSSDASDQLLQEPVEVYADSDDEDDTPPLQAGLSDQSTADMKNLLPTRANLAGVGLGPFTGVNI